MRIFETKLAIILRNDDIGQFATRVPTANQVVIYFRQELVLTLYPQSGEADGFAMFNITRERLSIAGHCHAGSGKRYLGFYAENEAVWGE